MLSKICPCLSWLSSASRDKKKGYNPGSELEEEEFMHHIEEEGRRYEDHKSMGDDITPIEDRLDYELGLASKQQQKGIENYFKETVIAPNQQDKEEQRREQEDKQNEQLIDLNGEEDPIDKEPGQLIINLPEYDQHFNLLKQAAFNAESLLDSSKDCTEIPITSLNPKGGSSSKLKINKSKLRAWRKSDPATTSFNLEYTLPCSFSFYTELTSRKLSPNSNNKLIKQFSLLESLHPNLSTKYICFNKIGMLEPREFTYLKYTNNGHNEGHWELCVSLDSNTGKGKAGKVRSINYITENHSNGVNVRVRSFIQVDIGVSLQKIWEKIFMDVKNYIEWMWEEAAENYEQELV